MLPFDKGSKPKKDIPEYCFDHTEKLPNGDTKHYYVQVVTRHVDVDTMKELAEVEEGTQPKRSFDGITSLKQKQTMVIQRIITNKLSHVFVDKSGKDLVPI